MMTSVVPDATRGNRDRAQPQTAHTSQPQKQIQATAEQIRLAQMIYDKNDGDFEGKVKQLIEVTGRNQDECMVALHDCNGDVNRAINFLLEEVPAKDSWETVGKKKSVGKEAVTATETRERRTDREGRGRGGPNRRGRGASRGQEGRSEENGFDSAPGERGERGRRGRGRGPGGRGRGRGDVGNRFSQGMGTFYPAEYTVTAEPGDSANNTTDGSWRNNLEDWAAEDWNEDLSETKVFTATFALASQNHVTPGQGGDLSSMLPKGSEDDSELVGLEPMSLEPLTQSLVFTNSQQHAAHTHTHSYASAAANSYASAAAGTYAHAALGLGSRPPQADLQKAEPVSAPRISPLLSQAPVTQRNGSPVRERTSPSPPVAVALNEPKVETPVTVSQVDLKAQPDPSPVLSQLPQHQNYTLQTDLPVQGRNPSPPMPPRESASPVLKPLGETNAPIMAEPHQPKHVRPQRRRLPPPSKIPLSAVEMPGSADVSGLNVQFGALDFASESTVENSNQSEPVSQEPAPPVTQTQSSLYSKPSTVSETITSLLPAISASTVEPRYPSPSVGLPTATAPTASPPPRVEPPSLRKEPTTTSSTPLINGYSDVRPTAAKDAAPTSTPQSMSTSLPSDNSMISSSLPSSSSSAPAPSPSTALPSLSSTHVSSGTTLGSAAPVTSAMNSHVASDVSSFSSTALNSNGLINSTPSLSTNGPSAPSTARSAPMQTSTSSKAPPNLPQGVPPLLANQYIMGPGGLLPAYPQIYGYEELQLMQSRMPMDYYGMPAFPGTTTLAARDGGLANNPYSGDATKFARGEAPSPAPPTSLSSVTSSQSEPGSVPTQSQAPQNPGHSFLNPPLPPGYGYTSLPYYTGMPGVPSAFQYAPTVFVPTASAKQHAQYQHQAGYGGHAYASGFDDLSQAHAGGDYGKGAYGGSAQSQPKPGSSTGKAPGLSGSASSDLSGTVYSKTQSFEKQGFPTATPATFSLPSALGGTGPLNPGGAPGYAHAPFLHILPHHQQPPSQLLHHHMAQDTQVQRNQSSSMQKSQGKSTYSSSPYWAN